MPASKLCRVGTALDSTAHEPESAPGGHPTYWNSGWPPVIR